MINHIKQPLIPIYASMFFGFLWNDSNSKIKGSLLIFQSFGYKILDTALKGWCSSH